jgi:hypothetical protein
MFDCFACLHELTFDCLVFVMQQGKGLEEHLVSSRHIVLVLMLLLTLLHQPGST